MSKRAIAITIGSTLLVIALSFLIICTVSFWKMKTQKDTSYQDGFNDGLTEKAELELSVAELRRTNSELTTQLTTITNTVSANERTISELRASKTALEEQVATLTADNEANSLEITRLTALKTSYETQINNLSEQNAEKQATITQLVADKSALNTQITALQNENAQNEQTISSLQDELENSQGNNVALQTQIATLQARINQNNLQIAELQSSRAELENRVLDLNDSISTNVSTINSLNGQITSLNAQITNLTSANNSNVNTIASLNSQVSVLTNRINELSYTNVEQSNRIVYLNAQIAKLNDYISKYDQFLTGFESETQAIATFELDGSLYNIQLVTNGGYANVDSPANTQYLIFNGWTVNNTIVNLSTYAITQNTKFIADVTHKYDVSFVVDSDVINTQIIAKNGHATAPANPIKSGYTFLGWTINGTTVVDPASVSITDTTTFTALFTQQFTVNFVYDNNTVSTQSIDKGSYGVAPTITNTEYLIFNGWTINGGLVDVATYPITQNTTFVADITYKYDVTFVVDNETVNSQIIVKNGYASVPTAPTKANYEFDGWTIDGTTVVNPLNIAITANTVFTAKFTRLYNVTFTYEETTESAQVVRNGNYANNVTVNSTTYKVFNGWKLNGVIVDVSATPITVDTNFVADITYKYDVIFKVDDADYNTQLVIKDNYATLPTAPIKNGYAFDGWSIDGTTIVDPTSIAVTNTIIFIALFHENTYSVSFVSNDNTISTQTITSGAFATAPTLAIKDGYAFDGWSVDNENIVNVAEYPIVSNTVFLAKTHEKTFSDFTWNELSGDDCVYGKFVWTDGADVYLHMRSSGNNYILDKLNNTWGSVSISNCPSSLCGQYVWTDGVDTYYSNNSSHMRFDKQNSRWVYQSFTGLTSFYAENVWTDGVNIYYSNNTTDNYKFNKATKSWSKVTFNGLAKFYGQYVWTDGVNIYYDYSYTHKILDPSTLTWSDYTLLFEEGVKDSLCYGSAVFFDGTSYYFVSSNSYLYVKNHLTGVWERMSVDLSEFSVVDSFVDDYLWTDVVNIYYGTSGRSLIFC